MSVARHNQILTLQWPKRLASVEAGRSWCYSSDGTRDLRLDLLRGFCVFAMIVNHIGGESWLYPVTGGGRFFTSAAEGFVFISGLVLGMVSVQRIRQDGLVLALWAVLRRARVLYVSTVVLTLGFATYAAAIGLPWGWDISRGDLLEIVAGTLTLHRTFYLIDILLLYTLLLLATPIALLFLIRGRTKLLLVGSWLLWGIYQYYPQQASIPWYVQGGDAFPLAAWQVLFVTGLVLGYHRSALADRLRWLPRHLYLVTLAVLFAVLISMSLGEGIWPVIVAQGEDFTSMVYGAFEKSSVGPGRIVAFAIVFQFAYLVVTMFWQPVRAAVGSILLPLGQNALYAYTVHVVVIWVFLSGQLESVGYDSRVPVINTWFQLGAIILIWLLIRRRFMFAVVPR